MPQRPQELRQLSSAFSRLRWNTLKQGFFSPKSQHVRLGEKMCHFQSAGLHYGNSDTAATVNIIQLKF